jgi:hypothetical protein
MVGIDRWDCLSDQPPPLFLWAVAFHHSARNEYIFHSNLKTVPFQSELNLDSRLRLPTAVHEAFTERVFSRTHALADPCRFARGIELQAAARAVWMPNSAAAPPPPTHTYHHHHHPPVTVVVLSLQSRMFLHCRPGRVLLFSPPPLFCVSATVKKKVNSLAVPQAVGT